MSDQPMKIDADQTLADWLAVHSATRPEAVALVTADAQINYAQLSQKVAALASGLAGLGIGKGDVVGIQLPNLAEYVISFLAVTSRGGIVQTLHMPYRRKELRGLLADASAKAIIVTNAEKDSRAEDVMSVRGDLPDLDHIIVVGPAPEGCVALHSLMETGSDPLEVVEVNTQDEYLLLYTSGTTADPKGVPHVYRSFLNNAQMSARQLQIDADSRILSLAPMTHLYGLFTMHLAFASGATLVLLPAFNPKALLDDLKSARASHIFAAPAHFAPFVAQGMLEPDHFRDTKVLCLSGAAVPQVLARTVDDILENGVVIQLWGMSELQAGTFGRPGDPAEKRFATAGAAVPRTEIRITGDGGEVLGAGQEGALEVRGPSVFAGYLNRPEENAKAFKDDGWFATGDLAVIDEDGFMMITGRLKEIINRGGIKYNPVEVEEIITGLPAIQQCAIVPIPDPDLGERGCLCVQLSPGAEISLEDVTTALSAIGMSKTKWPEKLVVLEELPLTPTRKIMRGTLVKMLQNHKDR